MGAVQLESVAAQHAQAKLNVESLPQGPSLFDGNDTARINGSESDEYEKFDKGLMQYGCAHYRRRCRIRAPCCNEIFDCRHCHNESKNSIKIDTPTRHELPRHELQQVICTLCGTEQEVRQVCINCGVCMGKYFCEVCKLFDDDVSKQQYHCHACGICRIGGRENFFHCSKCVTNTAHSPRRVQLGQLTTMSMHPQIGSGIEMSTLYHSMTRSYYSTNVTRHKSTYPFYFLD
ncbi:probable E3 ubiquitin-protein ligase RZFP34 isoform X2 [Triticum dicoccoides]|uniref:probable E3 ubiquitin-protein ligase RZFP34 isoform X2 n=1 Tax=Triticum dicoccoides TaxID=85692 RepID=UPI00188EBC78|nr:probable E3 ubiquitin-protein ligase RZFP34 isoform X2 [Triticum dicoccoides]